MAFKKVSGQKKYYKYAECSEGQRLVDNGEYLGSEEGTYGIQYNFKQNDGTIVVLNKAGHLDFLMGDFVVPGQRVNIDYAGKTIIPKGTFKGKEAHNFQLEVDDTPITAKPPESAARSLDLPIDDISL